MNFYYSRDIIDSLNNDIKQFKNISPIQQNDMTTFEGISRLVMLDRYSQKDKYLSTLKVGDLVICLIKDDSRFPTRGIGNVVEINDQNIAIKIEENEASKIPEGEANTENIIYRTKDKIEKPLEIYYEQIARRVGRALANIEKDDLKDFYAQKFTKQIQELNIVPAGRVLYGAGSDSNVTFFNCYVMPNIADSRDGISRHRSEIMEIMSRGGGVGTNGSTLRPRGTVAINVGGHSSGAVSWLNDLSKLTHLIEQGGSRRGAQMIMLNDWHPDIVEFILSKMQNESVLLQIKKHFKDKKIIDEANKKLKFIPLSSDEKELYDLALKNVQSKDSFLYKKYSKLLNDGGKYTINDSEFLTGANISIGISNNFMHAVQNNLSWELKYPDIQKMNQKQKEFYDKEWHKIGDVREWEKMGLPTRTYYKINAKELWELINFCARYSAEPGVFFIDIANTMTNAKIYGQKVVCTNPCGEQPLSGYSVCNLAAINLSNFVNKNNHEILFDKLKETVGLAIRMQDNVIDSTPYFLENNKKQALGERRIGLGVMGLHDMLIWANKKYGTDEANEVIDKVMQTIANTAYETSAELSKEKGAFPFLKEELYADFAKLPFVQRLNDDVKMKIANFGIRNSHLLTIAPTGSTGTMIGVSTGLEPFFAFEYYRSGRLGNMIKVKQKIVTEWLSLHGGDKYDENNLPDIFISAMDLSPEDHVKVQTVIQKWVDSSISKTVNAPKEYTVAQVAKIYETLYKSGAKGGTVYIDGSRNSQVLTLSDDESKNDFNSNNETNSESNNLNQSKIEIEKSVGIEIGQICPVCLEGKVISSGGCNTCNSCGVQLKCGL